MTSLHSGSVMYPKLVYHDYHASKLSELGLDKSYILNQSKSNIAGPILLKQVINSDTDKAVDFERPASPNKQAVNAIEDGPVISPRQIKTSFSGIKFSSNRLGSKLIIDKPDEKQSSKNNTEEAIISISPIKTHQKDKAEGLVSKNKLSLDMNTLNCSPSKSKWGSLKKKPTITTIKSVKQSNSDDSRDSWKEEDLDQLNLLKSRFKTQEELHKYLNFFSKPKRKINYMLLKTNDKTIDERNLTLQQKLSKESEIAPSLPLRIKQLSEDTKKNYHYLNSEVTKRTFNFKSVKLLKQLCDINFKGPYYSHCSSCVIKNINYYNNLDEKDALNIVELMNKSK